jgi:hypothetical protein
MLFDDVDDLAEAWRLVPPAPVTLRGLEHLFRAWLGVPDAPESAPSAQPQSWATPMTIEEMQALAERMNGAAKVMA